MVIKPLRRNTLIELISRWVADADDPSGNTVADVGIILIFHNM